MGELKLTRPLPLNEEPVPHSVWKAQTEIDAHSSASPPGKVHIEILTGSCIGAEKEGGIIRFPPFSPIFTLY